MEELTLEQKEQKLNQFMKDDPEVGINAMAAIGMFEVLSKKVAECQELVEQYKKTYPEIMKGGLTIIMAAGLFPAEPDNDMGIMPIEFVEGFRGSAKNMINKLKKDVEE